MTLSYADRVLETSTSQGTGTINLSGAVTGFQSFVSGIGTGKKCVYFIEDGIDWESGVGTVTAGSPDTLSRDLILESSNSDVAIDWGPGTRNVFLGASAHALVWRDENGNDTNAVGESGGTGNAHTLEFDHTIFDYSDQMIIRWRAPAGNTGAVTVNVNSLGAKALVQNGGAAFTTGLIPSGALLEAIYDEANDRFERTTQIFVAGQGTYMGRAPGSGSGSPVARTIAEVRADLAGKQTIYVPAGAFMAAAANGATPGTIAFGTSLVNMPLFDFAQSVDSFIWSNVVMPKNWNKGTIRARVYWTATAGTSAQVVRWLVGGGCYGDADLLTAAIGTSVAVDDPKIANNNLMVTDFTANITLGGSPSVDNELVALRVARNGAHANDTFATPAKFLGVLLEYTTVSLTDD